MENDIVKVLEHVRQLYADKEKLAIALELSKLPKERSYRSESINELAGALSKAQSEFHMAGMNKSNPFYKSNYADLAAVVEAARPALAKNNLAVVQDTVYDEGGTLYLYTLLIHTSNQWIESRIKIMPPKTDMHSIAGYITYMKRVSFASLVGVVTGDEDDDGEEVMKEQRKQLERGVSIPTQQKPSESMETLTKTEIEQLEDELTEFPELVEDILRAYDVRTIADLPRSRFKLIITRVRERKLNRNGGKS